MLLLMVPGPSVMFIVGRGIALGRRAALTTLAGDVAGIYLQVVLVAFGVGAIVGWSPAAFTAVKVIGAAYLVWLGVSAFRNRRQLTSVLGPRGTGRSSRTLFMDGVVVGSTNVKAIIFLAAILPQYVSVGGLPVGLQLAFLGLIFVVLAFVVRGVWAIIAGTARTWFAHSPERLVWLGGAGGLVMIGLALELVISGPS